MVSPRKPPARRALPRPSGGRADRAPARGPRPAVVAWLAGLPLLAACVPTTSSTSGSTEPLEAEVAVRAAGLQPVEVLRIVDGDTLVVRADRDGPAGRRGQQVTVRLLEIDTPEVERDGRPGECYADEATDALSGLLPPGSTALAEADDELRDQYGRTLLYLHVRDGEALSFVNGALVAGGYARAVLFEPNDRHIEQMRSLERQAREAGRGLWDAQPSRDRWIPAEPALPSPRSPATRRAPGCLDSTGHVRGHPEPAPLPGREVAGHGVVGHGVVGHGVV